MVFPLKMVIFHSYVSLPEGTTLEDTSEDTTTSANILPSTSTNPSRRLVGHQEGHHPLLFSRRQVLGGRSGPGLAPVP